MLGEALALIAALSWGMNHLFVRKGLVEGGSPFLGVRISVLVNCALLWPLALLLTDFRSVTSLGVGLLVLAGLFAPTLGRLMRFVALDKLGISGSTPIIATSPLFASALAMIIRGENITLLLLLGTLLIVVGVAFIYQGQWRTSRSGVLASLTTALAFGLAENFRKMGVMEVGSPPLGAAVGATVALIAYNVYARATGLSSPSSKKALPFFVLGGVSTSIALLSTFAALNLVEVVVAVPLFNTTPLFALFFSKLFLREHERVTSRIVLSTALVVMGATLILLN